MVYCEISFIRFISIILVLICHVLQAMNNRGCYYFNIGVYFFLFISGYIYAKKGIDNFILFYKKRFIKLLIPYYFLIFIILIVDIKTGETITIKGLLSSLMCLQWYGYSIPQCGHLWYISCILFCYILIPLLQWVYQ